MKKFRPLQQALRGQQTTVRSGRDRHADNLTYAHGTSLKSLGARSPVLYRRAVQRIPVETREGRLRETPSFKPI
jgi:hypothetical protein